jgi:2-succinyl-6-hydroxy-2,4-cyclohexadiene-1-carboxylate synthase
MPSPPTTSLHHQIRGHGPRLVLAHGFTQTGRLWGAMDDHLTSDHQVVQVDMPGHGDSARIGATLVDGALGLVDVGGRATYVGYSMGARFCLHTALARPDAVDALVLISGTAGIDDNAERRARRNSDLALADRLDPPEGSPEPPVPIEAFLRQWMEQPMFSNLGPDADGIQERLRNTGPGLASSLRLAGTGIQRPLWGLLGRLSMPVLVVTGGQDSKFTALGARMVDAIGANAEHVVIPGAGHAPHLEHPRSVATVIRSLPPPE